MTVGTVGYRESRPPNEEHTCIHTYIYGKQSFEMLKLKTEKIIGFNSCIQHRQKQKNNTVIERIAWTHEEDTSGICYAWTL